VDFVLSDETNPTLPAPENLVAVAWTTPFEETRSPSQAAGLEAVKRMFDARRATRLASSRVSPLGNHVEVDLYWDPLPGQYYDALLGFGIYRALTAQGPSTAIDFLRDPNAAFFADIDDSLLSNRAYYYEITALNTSYPDFQNSESAFSNRYGLITLGDLELLTETQSPLRFRWLPATGAEEYMVFLFDEFPSIGVTAIWDNSATPTTGTSYTYDGPPLQSGARYYYVVIALANGSDSRSLSWIADFVAN
jgi:hypothetical protein